MDTLRTSSVQRRRVSSGWVDALTSAIDRARLPNPTANGLALIAAILAPQALRWMDGSAPRWSLSSIAVPMGVWLVLPLALMHYLDRMAHAALGF